MDLPALASTGERWRVAVVSPATMITLTNRVLFCALHAAAIVSGCAGAARTPARHPAIGITADAVEYAPAPPNMPKGVEIAVLEGDPKRADMFTLRLRLPAGFSLIPHTHPVDERVTVLEGSVSVGFGQQTDAASAREYRAGSFYVNPPGEAHYVLSTAGAVIQITAMGPWRVDFLIPKDGPVVE